MNIIKTISMTTAIASSLIISGCSINPGLDYSEYNQKIVLCKQLNMNVRVVQGVKNNIPYVKEVICKDENGGSWNAEQLSD